MPPCTRRGTALRIGTSLRQTDSARPEFFEVAAVQVRSPSFAKSYPDHPPRVRWTELSRAGWASEGGQRLPKRFTIPWPDAEIDSQILGNPIQGILADPRNSKVSPTHSSLGPTRRKGKMTKAPSGAFFVFRHHAPRRTCPASR